MPINGRKHQDYIAFKESQSAKKKNYNRASYNKQKTASKIDNYQNATSKRTPSSTHPSFNSPNKIHYKSPPIEITPTKDSGESPANRRSMSNQITPTKEDGELPAKRRRVSGQQKDNSNTHHPKAPTHFYSLDNCSPLLNNLSIEESMNLHKGEMILLLLPSTSQLFQRVLHWFGDEINFGKGYHYFIERNKKYYLQIPSMIVSTDSDKLKSEMNFTSIGLYNDKFSL